MVQRITQEQATRTVIEQAELVISGEWGVWCRSNRGQLQAAPCVPRAVAAFRDMREDAAIDV